MFDVPLAEKCTERFSVELPTANEPWDVGLIVGPSGSGKSTVARECFGDILARAADWPADRAVVDCFGDLAACGKSSSSSPPWVSVHPPSWVKPYQVLSTGQRFRCDLARALGSELSGAMRESEAWQSTLATAPSAGSTRAYSRLRRIHQRRGSHGRQGLFDGDCQGDSAREHSVPVRGGDLSLRCGRVARGGLGVGHGHGSARTEAASAATYRTGNLSLPVGCLAIVCATSLSERQTRTGCPLLPGPLERRAGHVLCNAADDRPENIIAASRGS